MKYSPEQLKELEKELQQENINLRTLNEKVKESHRMITNTRAMLYYHTKKGVKERYREYYLKSNPTAMKYNNNEKRPIKNIKKYEIEEIPEEPINDSQIEQIQTNGKVKFGF